MDARTLEQAYLRYYASVRSIIRHRVRDSADADDLAQAVFVKLAVNSPLVDGGDIMRWLSRVAINASIDHIRKKDRVWDRFPELRSEHVSAELTYLHEEELDRLRQAIRSLPDRQRIVVQLAYFDALTHQQIAKSTGIALGTVKTRIRRGVHLLRVALSHGL